MAWVIAWAALAAPQSEDEKKILALIEELTVEDAAARRRALDGLLERGAAAVPLALSVLANERPGLEAQVDDWVKKLADPEWKERDKAHKALVRLGRQARSRLQAREGAADPEVAWRVKAALAEIEEREKDEALFDGQRAAALCEYLGLAGDPRAAPALRRQLDRAETSNPALADAEFAARVRAAEALGRLRAGLTPEEADSAAERAITMLERTRDRRHAVAIVRTLGRLHSGVAVTPLLSLLRKDGERRDVHLKRVTLRALADLGDARGVAGVVGALDSDDAYLRDGAVEVLSELAGTDFGIDPRQSPEAGAEKIRAARTWWEKKYGKPWPE